MLWEKNSTQGESLILLRKTKQKKTFFIFILTPHESVECRTAYAFFNVSCNDIVIIPLDKSVSITWAACANKSIDYKVGYYNVSDGDRVPEQP